MRLSSFVTDPLGRSATCPYNADDHVTSTTDRDGRRTTFSYDSGGRETGETWYDSSGQVTGHITFTYDNTGRMTGADDPNALLTFTYDSRGNQLTQATSGPGTGQPDVTLSSAYDGNNNRTSLADNLSTSNTITYDYDLANRMTTIGFSASTGSYAVAFGYDSGGNVTSVDRLAPSMFGLGNPTTTTIAYDAANRVTTMTDYSYTTSMSGGTTTPLATYLYGYDNANRVTSETDKEGLVTFSYDSGGQLLTARGSRTENYSYDFGGNRDMTGYTTGTGNELTSGGGYTFTYDSEGNTTGETQLSTGDGWTFGYDNRNRMVAAEEKSSGGTILCQATYTYDAENRRIGEDVNGTRTWTVYDGQNAYADFNGSGALQHRYIMGAAVDEVLGRIDSSGNVAWYLTDRLGTVRDVVNTTGTVLDHVVYDSFGDVTSETNASNGDRFKFTGREYDAATGMYYYRARYYDPATGRFEEQDPSGYSAGDVDLYRYVENGPINATDPTGEAKVEIRWKYIPVPGPGGVIIPAYHAYIIVIDEQDNNREYIFRAGPDLVDATTIFVYVGPYFKTPQMPVPPDWPDKRTPKGDVHQGRPVIVKQIIDDDKPATYYGKLMGEMMREVNAAHIPYQFWGQNSNTTARYAAEKMLGQGNIPLPKDLTPLNTPGWNLKLKMPPSPTPQP